MQFSITALLLAASPLLAYAAPATAGPVRTDSLGSHGDGFYTSHADDDGTQYYKYHGEVSPSKRAVSLAARDDKDHLNSDESVTCMGGGNVNINDLSNAQNGLAAQLGSGGYHISDKAFYYSGDAVAFACSYASGGINPTGNQFNTDMSAVSIDCGSTTSLGYVKDPHASYGRTFQGDHYC